MKRRKKSTAAPNPKRMFEESQMVRRVKAYLNNLQVETDEARLDEMSLECEGAAPSSSSSVPGSQRSKRHASPAPSTTSSTSSASDERKPTQKFGEYINKLLTYHVIGSFTEDIEDFNVFHPLIYTFMYLRYRFSIASGSEEAPSSLGTEQNKTTPAKGAAWPRHGQPT